MPKCPVCKSEMLDPDEYIMDGHILLESSSACPEGHYFTNYVTGNTEEKIGSYIFYSCYLDWKPENKDRAELHQALCNWALEIAKKEWLQVQQENIDIEEAVKWESIRR